MPFLQSRIKKLKDHYKNSLEENILEYNVNEMKLLATGGEANIYEVNQNQILRVIYKKESKADKIENIVFPILEQNKIHVPHIYEYLLVDNKNAQLMERIDGPELLTEWIKHPFFEKKQTDEFSNMHYGILQIETDNSIPSLNEFLNYFFENVKIDLDENKLKQIRSMFQELPAKQNICHGDFHPGNILVAKDQKVIIDWSGVHTGNPISDVANTYLLMTYVPQMPNQSMVLHSILKKLGFRRAEKYKKKMEELLHFDDLEFEKWLVVMSLFRMYCGLPSEKDERKRFILEHTKG